MSQNTIGNEDNMAVVNELIAKAQTEKTIEEKADQVNLGGMNRSGVLLDYTSEYGTKVEGWIEFKRPTAFELMQMGAEKSEILRRAGVKDPRLVDNSVMMMAHALATLSKVIAKRPPILMNLEDIQEMDIIFHVYGQYEVWEDSFRQKFDEVPSGDSETSE